ncbi:chorismate synthase [Candidatus Parcubacteria bacterium]|jgi:chorismate synthase|nr:chorismate synthase [Candidatus Parcubacteria bacterium]MBT3949103.1 chorismate synthase [Candidatus Parcubacteria bacterium]
MAGNIFGQLFKITTFGESHGVGVGVVIDGCPAGLEVTREEIQVELDKRRPGQSDLTTPRQEKDQVEILSGIFENKTLGTPIALLVRNEDADSKSYDGIKTKFRPGHADYVYEEKYGVRDYRGGGRASARETIGRVAAGAIAKKILKNIIVEARLVQVGKATQEKDFSKEIEDAKKDGDSVGGVIEVIAKNVPVGLGEPVFHKLSADLAHALMTIPATKGVEIGDGFESAAKLGSDNNDEMETVNGEVKAKTNHAGGIVGGISNGETIILRVAFKPTSSIAKKQNTVDKDGNEVEISVQGRHDPCVALRAVPIVEAMTNLVLVDHYLLSKISKL